MTKVRKATDLLQEHFVPLRGRLPICNNLVVMSLGVSGALTWFVPAQPFLAVGSLALLGYALWQRVQRARACRVSVPHDRVGQESHIEVEQTPRLLGYRAAVGQERPS